MTFQSQIGRSLYCWNFYRRSAREALRHIQNAACFFLRTSICCRSLKTNLLTPTRVACFRSFTLQLRANEQKRRSTFFCPGACFRSQVTTRRSLTAFLKLQHRCLRFLVRFCRIARAPAASKMCTGSCCLSLHSWVVTRLPFLGLRRFRTRPSGSSGADQLQQELRVRQAQERRRQQGPANSLNDLYGARASLVDRWRHWEHHAAASPSI